jgi:hypothetical protein
MALCLSCTPTPFDLTLSQSAQTVRKMTLDNASLITIKSSYEDDVPSDAVFYPMVGSAGFDYSAGMVTWQEGMYMRVEAVEPETGGGTWYTSAGDQGQIISNPDENAPSTLAWPAKGGSPHLFCIAFDALYPAANNRYSVMSYDIATKYFSSTGGLMSTLIETLLPSLSVTIIGASVTAEARATYDLTHWLARDDAGAGYVEVSGNVYGSSLTGAAAPIPRGAAPYALSFLPADLTRCMYYYDENAAGDPSRSPNRSFASWYDGASVAWRCWAWWEETAGVISSAELPISCRVDALLSSGQLLSTQGGTGRLYDRDGSLLASFPLGDLVYIGEQYVDGAARTCFQLRLVYDKAQHFNVYWIATSALATLGQ